MSTGLFHIHSTLAYLVLAGLIVSVLIFWFKRFSSKEFKKSDKTLALITLIFTHLQLVFGLLVYFIGPKGFNYFQVEGFMKDSVMRLYAIEHIGINLLAIALITAGYSRAKRLASDSKKFSSLGIFYLLGLVLILSRIPWDMWLA